MEFLLRIFFSGLIALVPSTDGKELTVLLLESHGRAASGGSTLPHHYPVLLARADTCTGDCNRQDPDLAQFFFSDRSASQAADALAIALQGGGAWKLANTDLSVKNTGEAALQPPLLLQQDPALADMSAPVSSAEREDLKWVPDLKKVLPSFGTLNPALFAARPPQGIVAARLRLKSGRVFSYALVRIADKVQPIHFRAPGSNSDAAYAQAAANWVAAEIRVPGDSVEIVGRNFDDGAQKSMRLTPRDGLVEMAVLNLPPLQLPVAGAPRPLPQPGEHFAVFYDMAQTPAAAEQRPIPHVRPATVQTDWQSIHPSATLWSALLEKLRLDIGRGPYDVLLCPVGRRDTP